MDGAPSATTTPTARLRPLLVAPDGRRVGYDLSTGAVVNDFEGATIVVLESGDVEINIPDGPIGSYGFFGIGTAGGPMELEFVANGDEQRATRLVANVSAGGAIAPLVGTVETPVGDVTPPTVTSPPSLVVPADSPSGTLAMSSAPLRAYFAGATATDEDDTEPVLVDATINGQLVTDATLLAVGAHRVEFAFVDESGNIGHASSTLTVVLTGAGAMGIPRIVASADGNVLSASWASGSGAPPAGYRVLLGRSPGVPDVAVIPVGALTAGQGALPAGRYYVWVESVLGQQSVPSPEAAVDVGGSLPPTPFLAAEVDGQQVRVSWTSTAVSPNTSYVLHVGTSRGASDVATIPMGQATAAGGTVPGGDYYLRVVASSPRGAVTSNEVAVRSACEAPTPPTGLTWRQTGGTVEVRWAASAGAISYVLEAGTSSTAMNLFTGNIGATTTIAASLPPGRYFVRLRAVGACASSGPSTTLTLDVQ